MGSANPRGPLSCNLQHTRLSNHQPSFPVPRSASPCVSALQSYLAVQTVYCCAQTPIFQSPDLPHTQISRIWRPCTDFYLPFPPTSVNLFRDDDGHIVCEEVLSRSTVWAESAGESKSIQAEWTFSSNTACGTYHSILSA